MGFGHLLVALLEALALERVRLEEELAEQALLEVVGQ